MSVNISYKHKNIILIGVTALLIIVAYLLAFQKTINAISLNRQLLSKSKIANNLAYSPQYLQRKNEVLGNLLHRYQVDQEQWQNQFWTTISNLAYENNTEVIYSSDKGNSPVSADSVSAVIKQNIQFSGTYKNLVKLTKSIESKEQNGQIVTLKMINQDRRSLTKKKILMDVIFTAIQQ